MTNLNAQDAFITGRRTGAAEYEEWNHARRALYPSARHFRYVSCAVEPNGDNGETVADWCTGTGTCHIKAR